MEKIENVIKLKLVDKEMMEENVDHLPHLHECFEKYHEINSQSESDKSLYVTDVISDFIASGGKVFVLDYAFSFKNNCQMLGGQYVEFDRSFSASFNPFSGIPEGNTLQEIDERDSMLQASFSLFKSLLKKDAPIVHEIILERCILAAWSEKKTKCSIDDVFKHLKKEDSIDAKDVCDRIFSFTSLGEHGNLFNEATNLDFDENYVVLEMWDFKNYPNLLMFATKILVLQIAQYMARHDRKTPFIIIVGEGEKLVGKNVDCFNAEINRLCKWLNGSFVASNTILDGKEHVMSNGNRIFVYLNDDKPSKLVRISSEGN